MKELADIRLPVVVSPPPHHRFATPNHSAQPPAPLSVCSVPRVFFAPVHRLPAGDSIQIERIGLGGPLRGGHPKSPAPPNFVPEELEPVSYVYDAGFLRMQADAELLLQERFRQ